MTVFLAKKQYINDNNGGNYMKNNEKLKKKLLIIIISIIIIGILINLIAGKIKNNINEISYNDFMNLVKSEKVKEVTIDFSSEKFTFKDSNDGIFTTDNPKDTDFKKFLLQNDIKVFAINDFKGKTIVNIIFGLLRLSLIVFLLKTMYKSMGVNIFEKKEALVEKIPNVTFNNIAGNHETKKDMQFLVNFLKNPQKYYDIGAKLPKGVVLYGPPGTGKTLTAKAIAGEAGVPFFSASGSDFIEMYAGLGAKRVRDLFKDAKEKAPCIVFIDEIDAIGTKRGDIGGNSEKDQTINALLAELDGFNTKEPIITIIATNRVEDLDPALIRPGRFDKHIAVGLPDNQDRLEILKIYAETKKIEEDVDLEELAKLTIGFSGAGLEALMNEAAINAVNNNLKKIRKEDIDDAYFKIVMKGHKKENRKETDGKELELVAYHEAGHALCAKLLTDNDVPKVTILPSTSGAGGVTFNIPKKMGLFTKREILNNIKVLYGGRASEYILRGSEDEITTGASQDLKQATKYLNAYFSEYGMSEEFGMLQIEDEEIFIDEAIKLSKQLYEETVEILKKNIDKLDKIAEELIEKETINEEDLDRIINS